jgi:transcriptional regulator with XRE-family HTH domain
MPKSPVSKRRKDARIAAGLSLKSLGIAAGIDEFSASARMNQYETGKHTPDYLIL